MKAGKIKKYDPESQLFEIIENAMKDSGLTVTNQSVNQMIDRLVRVTCLLAAEEIPVAELKEEIDNKLREQIGESLKKVEDLEKKSTRIVEHLYRADRIEQQSQKIADKLDMLFVRANDIEVKLSDYTAQLQDSKSKEMAVLFGTILSIAKEANADPNVAARCASYATWAYATNGQGQYGTLEAQSQIFKNGKQI